MALEEVSEHFMQNMRCTGFAPEIAANPTLLRPVGVPAEPGWVCGRVDGYLRGPPGRG